MYRATTPTFEFHFPEIISNYDEIQITFRQDDVKVIKDASNLTLDSGTDYYLALDQEETSYFNDGLIDIQVRVKVDDKVMASDIYRCRINDILDDTILED